MHQRLLQQIEQTIGDISSLSPPMLSLLEQVSQQYYEYEAQYILIHKKAYQELKAILHTLTIFDHTYHNRLATDDPTMLVLVQNIASQINHLQQVKADQKQLIADLEAANNELKDFAYIVSHDLKAPLRSIGSLTDWLLSDYASLLDEDGKYYLRLLKRRVSRMHSLIEGILQYARIGRIKDKLIPLPLNNIIAEVIDMLAPPNNISITIQPNLPTIFNDPYRMKQVFQNLLDNAIKYNDKETGIIEITCEAIDDFWCFSVKDNGPGISGRYHQKIFQIFQTLDVKDKTESIGLGLTIVKKIIEQNNGSIWVDSAEGKGATFYFTLPQKIGK